MVRTSPRRVSGLVAALVSVSLALFACGSGDDADESATPSGDGGGSESASLAVDLQRSTLFDTRREFGLTLAALGDTDLQLETVQLVTPLFEEVAPTQRDPVLQAGGAGVVMPLPYGTAICPGDDRDTSPQIAVVVDGEELVVPATVHPEDMLTVLHERECATAEVLDDVGLALDGEWTVVDPTTATGQLTLTQRTPGVSAAVDELLGNVILGVTTDGTAPAIAIDDTTPTASVGVTVSAARCDPHALTEYKRTFVFVALVQVDDGEGGDAGQDDSDEDSDDDEDSDEDGDEPVRVDVRAEGPAHAALGQLLASCVG